MIIQSIALITYGLLFVAFAIHLFGLEPALCAWAAARMDKADIKYIGEPQHAGEPDLLVGNEFAYLEIRDSNGVVVSGAYAPRKGWTHAELNTVLANRFHNIDSALDAYLNGQWIGSTEV